MPFYTRKNHHYTKQSDLYGLTPSQIVHLSPDKVKSSIETTIGDKSKQLSPTKMKALNRLLAIKRMHKRVPNERSRRQSIKDFLDREGLTPKSDVDELIVAMHSASMYDKVGDKMRENRFRSLMDQSTRPLTEEEEMYRRMNNIGVTLKRAGRHKKRTHKNR